MSLFRSSGRLDAKLAKNNDPMKQKRLWVKSFYCAAVLAALGLGANLANAAVLGVLGLPGFGLLLAAPWLLR